MGIDFSSLYGNDANEYGSDSSGTGDLKVCGIYHSTNDVVELTFSEFGYRRNAKIREVNSIQVFTKVQECSRQNKK